METSLGERRHQRTMHEAGQHDNGLEPNCTVCLDIYAADTIRRVADTFAMLEGTGLRVPFLNGIKRLVERQP